MGVKELTQEEMSVVSGGVKPGDNNRKGGNTSGSKNGGIYSGVDSCGAGIFGGMVAGAMGGPAGMVLGMVGGAIAGQCTKDSFSNKTDSKGGGSKR